MYYKVCLNWVLLRIVSQIFNDLLKTKNQTKIIINLACKILNELICDCLYLGGKDSWGLSPWLNYFILHVIIMLQTYFMIYHFVWYALNILIFSCVHARHRDKDNMIQLIIKCFNTIKLKKNVIFNLFICQLIR